MPGDAFQHTDGKVGVGVFQPLVRLKAHPHLVRNAPHFDFNGVFSPFSFRLTFSPSESKNGLERGFKTHLKEPIFRGYPLFLFQQEPLVELQHPVSNNLPGDTGNLHVHDEAVVKNVPFGIDDGILERLIQINDFLWCL